MDALKSLVSPLLGNSASNSMIDGMKLVVLGGTVETARRMSSSAWSSFVNSFFLTAHFSEEDYPYDWLMLWLSRRPEWQRSREFETTTRTVSPSTSSNNNNGVPSDNSFGDDDYDGADPGAPSSDDLMPGLAKTRVLFQPTFETTHTIFWRGHWLRIKRSRKSDGSDLEMLSVSVVARNNNILKQLVLQAKRDYEAESIHRIQIYFADQHGSWRWTDSRHKRPLSSIVLDPGVKEMLLGDARDFLKSERWYADRGIPFRRGYLLHGVPGAGKSSLIHAIAGELLLDIYVVSLSSGWMNDSTLTALMGRVPARCIVLLEDLDAAFTRSTNRDGASTGAPPGTIGPKRKPVARDDDSDSESDSDDEESSSKRKKRSKESSNNHSSGSGNNLSEVNTLTLSGLLNALDGVAASEGRLLFATTNHLERLDPALSRPGRMDVWIEFKNASPWQAEALFRNFFPVVEEEIVEKPGELEGIELPDAPATTDAVDEKSSTPKMAKGDFGSTNTAFLPPSPTSTSDSGTTSAPGHSAPPLTAPELSILASTFASSIPPGEFSVAALQGYLLKHKSRPEAAAAGAAEWVSAEKGMRERLVREREEREEKGRIDREKRRKARKEKREKEEREEKEKKEKEKAEKKSEKGEKSEKKETTSSEKEKDKEEETDSTSSSWVKTGDDDADADKENKSEN